MAEVLLFDLGGVLVDFAGFRELKSLLPAPLDDGEIRRRWLTSVTVRAFELGVSNEKDFATDFVREWSLRMSPSEFFEEFRTWPRAMRTGARDLLTRLHSDHRLACLSNTNSAHWEVLEPWVGDLFEDCFLSFRLGAVKPDPRVFELVLESLGVAARDVLFFDDMDRNVTAARSFGFHAETATSPAEIQSRLNHLAG